MENKIKMLILMGRIRRLVGATMSHVKSRFDIMGILNFMDIQVSCCRVTWSHLRNKITLQ